MQQATEDHAPDSMDHLSSNNPSNSAVNMPDNLKVIAHLAAQMGVDLLQGN